MSSSLFIIGSLIFLVSIGLLFVRSTSVRLHDKSEKHEATSQDAKLKT